MTKNNFEQWITGIKEEWEKQKKEGTYTETDWKAFLIWYVSEDKEISESIIDSWKDSQRIDE